jgi:hypothetical protein
VKCIVLCIFACLMGCSKGEPIKITEPQKKYIGTWQFLSEHKTENSLDFKNTFLAINADSTAVYAECTVSKSKSVSGNSNSSRSSSKSVSLPSAIIIALTDSRITLQQEAWILNFDYDLAITQAPYLESGRWYMGIDNTLLTKLDENELGEFALKECPDKDDENVEEKP